MEQMAAIRSWPGEGGEEEESPTHTPGPQEREISLQAGELQVVGSSLLMASILFFCLLVYFIYFLEAGGKKSEGKGHCRVTSEKRQGGDQKKRRLPRRVANDPESVAHYISCLTAGLLGCPRWRWMGGGQHEKSTRQTFLVKEAAWAKALGQEGARPSGVTDPGVSSDRCKTRSWQRPHCRVEHGVSSSLVFLLCKRNQNTM